MVMAKLVGYARWQYVDCNCPITMCNYSLYHSTETASKDSEECYYHRLPSYNLPAFSARNGLWLFLRKRDDGDVQANVASLVYSQASHCRLCAQPRSSHLACAYGIFHLSKANTRLPSDHHHFSKPRQFFLKMKEADSNEKHRVN